MSDTFSFLVAAAQRAAATVGGDAEASIMIRHRGAVVRAASSGRRAARCDDVEARFGAGPTVSALQEFRPVVVTGGTDRPAWQRWSARLAVEGFSALVVVPATAGDMDLALGVYTAQPPQDRAAAVCAVAVHVTRTAEGLLARLNDAGPLVGVPDAAPDGAVDAAVAEIMRVNGCGVDAALELLIGAATHRNVGLAEVAATFLEALVPAGEEPRLSA